MYRVIYKFRDLEDKNGHIYKIGDVFPYDDKMKISNKRINELMSVNNKIGKVLIVKISDNSLNDENDNIESSNEEDDNTDEINSTDNENTQENLDNNEE